METKELRSLSLDELHEKGREIRGDVFNAKVKHATGQLEDTARLRVLRRDVARVETVIREKSGEQE